MFKEVFNGFLQETYVEVDSKKLLNNEEQTSINLIHVQKGLVVASESRYSYLSSDIRHAF